MSATTAEQAARNAAMTETANEILASVVKKHRLSSASDEEAVEKILADTLLPVYTITNASEQAISEALLGVDSLDARLDLLIGLGRRVTLLGSMYLLVCGLECVTSVISPDKLAAFIKRWVPPALETVDFVSILDYLDAENQTYAVAALVPSMYRLVQKFCVQCPQGEGHFGCLCEDTIEILSHIKTEEGKVRTLNFLMAGEARMLIQKQCIQAIASVFPQHGMSAVAVIRGSYSPGLQIPADSFFDKAALARMEGELPMCTTGKMAAVKRFARKEAINPPAPSSLWMDHHREMMGGMKHVREALGKPPYTLGSPPSSKYDQTLREMSNILKTQRPHPPPSPSPSPYSPSSYSSSDYSKGYLGSTEHPSTDRRNVSHVHTHDMLVSISNRVYELTRLVRENSDKSATGVALAGANGLVKDLRAELRKMREEQSKLMDEVHALRSVLQLREKHRRLTTESSPTTTTTTEGGPDIPAIPVDAIAEIPEQLLCIVCEMRTCGPAFVPCGHWVMCVECISRYKRDGNHDCPTCRTKSTSLFNVYTR